MCRRSARASYRAFTLVELLVVTAILAILIALLLPALGRAREQAQMVACLANMRQLGIAYHAYAADFKGWPPYMPLRQHHSGAGSFYIMGGPSPSYDFDDDGGSVTKDGFLPAPDNRVLNRYMGKRGRYDMFKCPADLGMDLSDYWPGRMWPVLWESTGSSYYYNDYNRAFSRAVNEDGFWLSSYNQPISRLRPASKFILFYEPPALVWPYGFPNNDGVGGKITRWHRPGRTPGSRRFEAAGHDPIYANIIFADGHAETLDFAATLMRDEKGAIVGQDRRPNNFCRWFLSLHRE